MVKLQEEREKMKKKTPNMGGARDFMKNTFRSLIFKNNTIYAI